MRGMSNLNLHHDHHRHHDGPCCTADHEEVARAAFSIYQKHSSQDGHDMRNWLDAETHVNSRHASTVHGRQPVVPESNT